ncbi:helix-turn-helix domain-containing protein [Pseudoblastomonas halimionae]|uniref:Helix-turn-helix domain-containing protein n=1 Tax=Alteriqipengyuania halimionae TaxID=1926630 RepID=A0A6I4UA23_9SPHN|nr:AraC family transcriptional regulator [Alteriqipengyuania halimionae]MXP11121.1 helix-turn-helix domain-containing protein [Alteriqipengyuania halimionae]
MADRSGASVEPLLDRLRQPAMPSGSMDADRSSAPLARRPGEIWGERSRRQSSRGVDFAVYDAIDIEIEPHCHEDRHLIFLMSGQYITSAQGAPPVCATPVLVDNPAGTSHRDRFLGSTGRFLAINIDPALSWEGPATVRRDRTTLARMTALIEDLEFARPTLAVEELAAGLTEREPSPAPAKIPAWLARSWDLVMEEDIAAIDLDRVAREADIHPVHVARSFRRLCGRTAGQLLRDRQFEDACRMLARDNTPLVEIALALGFCDQAHFTNVFCRRAGVSPGAWRKRMRDV